MKFGICTSVDNAAAVKAAGWDYVEDSVQALLQGQTPDADWKGLQRVRSAPLPVPACNMLVPASLKITGPDADPAKLKQYLETVLRRAQQTGVKTLVFGSGGARQVPDGFDRAKAWDQVVSFGKTAASLAEGYGVTIVAEHLNRKECNILTSLAEVRDYLHAVNHPHMRCLVDTYHLWVEDESVEHVRAILPSIVHVHLADLAGRVAPGESGSADYRSVFRVLKAGGYSGTISVEALNFEAAAYPRVLEFVRREWQQS